MKTVIKVYRGIAAEYVAWRESLREFGPLIERELHAELIRTDGRPRGVRAVAGQPAALEWRFGANAVVGYTISIQFLPKQSPPHGSAVRRGWGWLVWRWTRQRYRLVLITSIGRDAGR